MLDAKAFKESLAELDSLVYEMVDNDLTFKQFEQLKVAHETLKHFGKPSFTNKSLIAALEQPTFMNRFEESHAAEYDPLKNRVVAGLTAGMTSPELKLMSDF